MKQAKLRFGNAPQPPKEIAEDEVKLAMWEEYWAREIELLNAQSGEGGWRPDEA